MSEECCDFVDCRIAFKNLAKEGKVNIHLSKHAIERLIERRHWGFKGVSREAIVNIVRNVFRDGEFKAFTDKVVVWTKNYVLICSINKNSNVIVKTVITRLTLKKELEEKLKKGIKVRWKHITVHTPKLCTIRD